MNLPNLTRGDYWRLSILGLLLLFFFFANDHSKHNIKLESFLVPVFATFFLIGVWLYYGWRDANVFDLRISRLGMLSAQAVILSNLMAIDNYLGLSFAIKTYDEVLARIDHSIGFDWLHFSEAVKSNAFFSDLLTLAYNSTGLQIVAIFIALNLAGFLPELERLTLSCAIAATMTVFIWVLAPTFGALPFRYAQGFPEPPLSLAMSKSYALELLELPRSPVIKIDGDHLIGLIGFPSFHTVLLVLTIYGAWKLEKLRIIIAAWNVVVLISILPDGGHHFVDVIGGILVAVASIQLARLAIPSNVMT